MTDVEPQESRSSMPPWWAVLAPLIVMAVIFGISSRSQLPDMDGGRDLQNVIGHFTVYAALGATLALLFRSMGWGILRSLAAAIVLATLYGVSDEFHQSFVPNRSVDSKDVLVDFLGATGGALAMLRLLDYRATKPPPNGEE
ncbi:MAG TPA: VanZ family protein [Thermomicrobiales bacterium]|jgi:VanZ family protein|nr:VanZ family protein [Thermomicrobiales bacterium]